MDFKAHKVVSALPGVLEPDSIYFVKTGLTFEIYVTNGVGTIIAHELSKPKVNSTPLTFVPTATGNTTNLNEYVIDDVGRNWFIDYTGDAVLLDKPTFFSNSGRAYLYTDNRWVSNSNLNQGSNNENFNQSEGTGTLPTKSWNRIGDLIPKGTYLDELTIMGMCNSTEVQGIRLHVVFRYADPVSNYDNGIDNVNETAEQILVNNGNFYPFTYTGSVDDIYRSVRSLNYVTPEDGYLMIYYRPSGTLTTTRYFRHSYMVKLFQ